MVGAGVGGSGRAGELLFNFRPDPKTPMGKAFWGKGATRGAGNMPDPN